MDDGSKIRLARGSEKFRELVDVIGKAAALKLCAARAGRRCYVPDKSRIGEDHWLAKTIGLDAALKLSRHVGTHGSATGTGRDNITTLGRGGFLSVPMAVLRTDSVTVVAAMTDSGKSSAQISQELRITQRAVHRNRAIARSIGLLK